MRVVVIGASAGGVQALQRLVRTLDADFPAPVFVVLHVPRKESSVLPKILTKAGKLPATHATDGEPILPGRIYVAPPDNHLLLGRNFVRVTRGPRENLQRPALDPLFRSAARSFDGETIGIVLSGSGSDGATGLKMIKERGGLAIVQDPSDCMLGMMPLKALEVTKVDWSLPADEIGSLLNRLVREPSPQRQPVNQDTDPEETEDSFRRHEVQASAPSQFSCPECHGVLWEIDDGEMLRYRCRVGHAYTAESLLDEQSDAVEVALWASLRALEERASLLTSLSGRFDKKGISRSAEHFRKEAEIARVNASVLQRLLQEEDLYLPRGEEGISTNAAEKN